MGILYFQLEESKSRVANLQQQVACLEDGLCEARMEASRARTELVSERSTAEIRLSEMQSKLNEVSRQTSCYFTKAESIFLNVY